MPHSSSLKTQIKFQYFLYSKGLPDFAKLPSQEILPEQETVGVVHVSSMVKNKAKGIFQLEKCRPLTPREPGALQKHCCERKQHRLERLGRRGKEEMGRHSSCYVQADYFLKKISMEKIHHMHTKK